jgi:hypothetical protein
MIAANELRIGNYLVFRNFIQPDQIIKIDARWFCSLAGGRSTHEIKPDEEINNYYSGIPLTPEILQKCGFEFEPCGISGADMWQGISFWKKGVITLRGNVSTAKGGVLHLSGYYNSQIKFIHQLQNIYFALTGKELEVNLEQTNLH